MNSSLFNEATISNYFGDVAVTMLFGMGYYLVTKLRKGKDEKKAEAVESKTVSQDALIEKLDDLGSLQDFHRLIRENTSQSPYFLLAKLLKKGINPTIDTYNYLLLNAYYNCLFQEANQLKEEIFEVTGPVSPNAQTLIILMKGIDIESKNRKDDLEFFDRAFNEILTLAKSREIELDLFSHNTYLNSLINQDRLAMAWNYYKENLLGLNSYDAYTYTILAKGIRDSQNTDRAWFNAAEFLFRTVSKHIDEEKSWKIEEETNLENATELTSERAKVEMRNNRKSLHENFLVYMLDIYVKYNENSKAEYLFNKYLSFFSSNSYEYAYSIMIKGLSRTHNVEKALDIFNLLKQKKKQDNKTGIEINSFPSIISYGGILNACVKNRKMDKAENILQEMLSNKIPLNSFIYSTFINGYKICHAHKNSYKIFKLVELDKENLTIAVVNSFLECCVDAGDYATMKEVYQKVSTEYGLQGDKITHSIAIKGYSKKGDFSSLWNLYEYLKKENLVDEILYNTLLDAFANIPHEENFFEIYSEMKKAKIPMSIITYGVLIKLYVNVCNITRAEEIFSEIKRKKLQPNVVIFQLMIKLYYSNGYTSKAIRVYELMQKEFNVVPDVYLYDYIAKIMLGDNRIKQVSRLFIEAAERNIMLDVNLMNSFLRKCYNQSLRSNFVMYFAGRGLFLEGSDHQNHNPRRSHNQWAKMPRENSNLSYSEKSIYA